MNTFHSISISHHVCELLHSWRAVLQTTVSWVSPVSDLCVQYNTYPQSNKLDCVMYLHGESLSIDGVLWPWSPTPSPVEVKLGGSVVARQSSSSQPHGRW